MLIRHEERVKVDVLYAIELDRAHRQDTEALNQLAINQLRHRNRELLAFVILPLALNKVCR